MLELGFGLRSGLSVWIDCGFHCCLVVLCRRSSAPPLFGCTRYHFCDLLYLYRSILKRRNEDDCNHDVMCCCICEKLPPRLLVVIRFKFMSSQGIAKPNFLFFAVVR